MRKIWVISLSILVMFSLNINASIDFKKNAKYYDQICSSRASYELNIKVCNDYKIYLENSDDAQKMQDSLKDTKLNAFKLAELIKKNNKIIEEKEISYKKNSKLIEEANIKMAQLEKDVINSIESMQYFSNENQVIDIIMSSTSLEDLMLRIDGFSQINRINIENIYELETKTNELTDIQRYLAKDIKKLEATKKRQNQLLNEFRRKEAKIYSNIDSGGNATFNVGLNSLDLSKINDTGKRWTLPLKSGEVSAGTWAYPDGGFHPAVDIANNVGTKILAPANGALLASSSSGAYGNHIVIVTKRNNYVYTMLFAHLSSFVGVNDFNRGDTIGLVGSTGASTGAHVHVEVIRHNTADVSKVVNEFKKNRDYWFGLGYSGQGDCSKVCRLRAENVFNLKVGTRY